MENAPGEYLRFFGVWTTISYLCPTLALRYYLKGGAIAQLRTVLINTEAPKRS